MISKTCCIRLILAVVAVSLIESATAVPGERMRVKYRIKTGGGRKVVDKAVAEVVSKDEVIEIPIERRTMDSNQEGYNLNEIETDDELLLPTISVNQDDGMDQEPIKTDDEGQSAPVSIENTTMFQVINTVVGMVEELGGGIDGALKGRYNNVVQEVVQGVQRAARYNEGTVGDVVFDVIKEVVAELVGKVLTNALGIGTARNGEDKSLVEIVLSAISHAGRQDTC